MPSAMMMIEMIFMSVVCLLQDKGLPLPTLQDPVFGKKCRFGGERAYVGDNGLALMCKVRGQ